MLHYLLSIPQTSQQAKKQSESCYLYSLLNFLMSSCLDGAIYLPYDNRESSSSFLKQCFPIQFVIFIQCCAIYLAIHNRETYFSCFCSVSRAPVLIATQKSSFIPPLEIGHIWTSHSSLCYEQVVFAADNAVAMRYPYLFNFRG